jgi:hypothetical protein
MNETHRDHVETLLADAAAAHDGLIARLPADMQASLPVDAQGVTQAIDHLAVAAGLTPDERLELIKPHAVNPAVLHARVFGRAPLAPETVIGSFVDGARVRADALAALADTVGGEALGTQVRNLLVAAPPPVQARGPEVIAALRATYAAQEQAAVLIATRLDAPQ